MIFYKDKKTGFCIPSKDLLPNENYIEIKPNVEEAALEKHIPVYKKKDGKILVTVGSVEHPMTDKHYIMWIALIKDDNIIIKELLPTEKPQAEFNYLEASEIYAYCNLHGLWKKEVE